LQLFATEDLSLRRLVESDGFVLGHVFDAFGAPASDSISSGLLPLEAQSLVRRVWGSYVAAAWQGESFRALRDPSGGLACYYAEAEGALYLTSVPHLLIDCGLVPLGIDWPSVLDILTRRRSRLPGTALCGIQELLPGTLLTFGRQTLATAQVWDPWRAAAKPPPRQPAERLEHVLSMTLRAWGRSTSRPLIEVSGGLDSAIVAAGIAAAAPGASLITFAAGPGDADETPYARAIAEHLGLDLEVVSPRVEDVDLTRSLSADLPRPNARAFTQAADAQSLRQGRAIGADAFVSGGGGDDVFCYLRTVLPAIDRLHAEGWYAMAATVRHIAVMNHSTYWEALARIVRRFIRGRSGKPAADTSFMSRVHDCMELDAPQSDLDPPAPPGKTDHVRGVLTIHNYLEGHARARFAPILSPLLSQPIVECCLSIPTWLWCDDGRNRAVARQAFRRHLPRIAIERRSKGGFDGFSARLFEANRSLIREMLVEGHLARQGVLEREAVLRAMLDPSLRAETITRLLTIVDVESWLTSWSSRRLQCG
jgi:asparagine synthase (glutamine-hydrolysing)